MALEGTTVMTRTKWEAEASEADRGAVMDPRAERYIEQRAAPAEAGPDAPRVSVGEAVMRHPLLTLLPVLLCMGAGLAVGLARTPSLPPTPACA